MQDALTYLYYIFDSFTSFIFNDAQLFTGVTLGWIFISLMLFAILIRSILNIPRSIGHISIRSSKKNEQ